MPWFRRIYDGKIVEATQEGSMIWLRPKRYEVNLEQLEGNYEPYTTDAGLFLDKLKAPLAQKIKGPTKGDGT